MTTSEDRRLEGRDILLNLSEICMHVIDSFSSTSCSGSVGFYFENTTKHGWVEDPDLSGTIKVLSAEKEEDHYILRVQLEQQPVSDEETD